MSKYSYTKSGHPHLTVWYRVSLLLLLLAVASSYFWLPMAPVEGTDAVLRALSHAKATGPDSVAAVQDYGQAPLTYWVLYSMLGVVPLKIAYTALCFVATFGMIICAAHIAKKMLTARRLTVVLIAAATPHIWLMALQPQPGTLAMSAAVCGLWMMLRRQYAAAGALLSIAPMLCTAALPVLTAVPLMLWWQRRDATTPLPNRIPLYVGIAVAVTVFFVLAKGFALKMFGSFSVSFIIWNALTVLLAAWGAMRLARNGRWRRLTALGVPVLALAVTQPSLALPFLLILGAKPLPRRK